VKPTQLQLRERGDSAGLRLRVPAGIAIQGVVITLLKIRYTQKWMKGTASSGSKLASNEPRRFFFARRLPAGDALVSLAKLVPEGSSARTHAVLFRAGERRQPAWLTVA
jgi:hypothetical protein